ncbi:glycosyltransferase family 1 protein [Wenzhouxiangella sp. XN79A]|uniref:glycosyltransferase n=1 Tax=Wenzhouxiangella sp. XN79A TaxID=2724193 RepID=UPI00144AB592|nr:glycosyltransferase [Wenzhouxiangella sp. XN79A]NKI35338.1 glycosyltransferase family 1 protein [Wenzhouxiangella sp. XN79A]
MSVRVAFVSDSEPERNGVGAYYADLIDQLGPTQVATAFVCPGHSGQRGFSFPLPGDSTQKVYLPSPRRLWRALREFEPTVVVVATPGPYGLLAAKWTHDKRLPLLAGFHTHYAGVTDLYGNSIFKYLSRAWFRFADRTLFRYADRALGNSAEMTGLAERLGGKRPRRIGTLVPRAVLDAPVRPLPAVLGRVLYAGRLAAEKRLYTVIDAARALPDIDFVIAGDGPLRARVDRAAAELGNLTATGWLTRPQLLEQMDAADALVLPSEVESFGTVALEAMARGRQAVVTSTCGIVNWPDLAEHLVVFGLDDALADVLERLAGEPAEVRQARAEAGRQAAHELNRSSLEDWIALLADPLG